MRVRVGVRVRIRARARVGVRVRVRVRVGVGVGVRVRVTCRLDSDTTALAPFCSRYCAHLVRVRVRVGVGVGVGVGVRVTAKVKLRGFDEHWRADAQGTATARPLGKRRAQALGAAEPGRAADGRARPRGHGSVESRLGLARP